MNVITYVISRSIIDNSLTQFQWHTRDSVLGHDMEGLRFIIRRRERTLIRPGISEMNEKPTRHFKI